MVYYETKLSQKFLTQYSPVPDCVTVYVIASSIFQHAYCFAEFNIYIRHLLYHLTHIQALLRRNNLLQCVSFLLTEQMKRARHLFMQSSMICRLCCTHKFLTHQQLKLPTSSSRTLPSKRIMDYVSENAVFTASLPHNAINFNKCAPK